MKKYFEKPWVQWVASFGVVVLMGLFIWGMAVAFTFDYVFYAFVVAMVGFLAFLVTVVIHEIIFGH